MAEAASFLWTHRGALLILIATGFGLVAIVQWLAWIFHWGRFRPTSNSKGDIAKEATNIRFVAAKFFVEIINDFRHLLALVVVGVFALALGAAMYPGLRHWNVEEIGEGVEGVAAALGGLIGSIIGYYFGESAAAQRRDSRPDRPDRDGTVQQPPEAGELSGGGIKAAPPPPQERTKT